MKTKAAVLYEMGAPVPYSESQPFRIEEVTLSGPVTDERAEPGKDQHWACTQDFVLRGVDESSIELDAGRWYFDEQACEAASPETAQFPGCIATLASQAGEATEQPPAAQAKASAKGKAR